MIPIETVRTENMEMKYFRFGSGKKNFVILPGLSLKSVTESADAVAAAYQCFEKEYTVWLFDRRTDLPKVYPVREMAADTAKAFDALGISDAYIFGASEGGMIAQFIAIDRPDLVHAMVLGSTASRLPAKTGTADKTDSNTDGIGEWIRLAESKDVKGLTLSFAQMVYTPAFFEQYKDLILQSADGVTEEDLNRFLILARGTEGMNAYDELDQIRCPVLALGAADDRVLGAAASEEIAKKLGCSCYIYENYGHAVYDEAPDYKDRIVSFFGR